MKNRCPICEAIFTNWPDFNQHHRTAHNQNNAVVPVKTTNRTKEEIVAGWEYKHHKAVIC